MSERVNVCTLQLMCAVCPWPVSRQRQKKYDDDRNMKDVTACVVCAGAGVTAEEARPRRTRTAAEPADRWRSLLAEYSRGAAGSWFPPAIPVQVPLQCAVPASNRAIGEIAPPASEEGLSQTSLYNKIPSYNEIPTLPPFTSSVPARPPPTPYGPPDLSPPQDIIGEEPMLPPVVIDPVATVSTDDYTVEELEEAKFTSQAAHSAHDASSGAAGDLAAGGGGELRAGPRRRLRCTRRRSVAHDEGGAGGAGGADEVQAPPPPPPPRFERSLYMRARLTVPRADYTEPYSIWSHLCHTYN
ncbi:hypothetical protein HW555_006754 [Spodoptera exigua]|uniref:Uncharacterized protein n=1 Tax=Spodoptera exigua TaxID=7107 RepID=A0A835L483_SPOEX|nr:hypothetical protein HW555_006754 [Spodoptera exigua]